MTRAFFQRLVSLNTILLVNFGTLLPFSVIALAIFAHRVRSLQKNTIHNNDANGHCVLYADHVTENLTGLLLSSSGACSFAIGGEAVLAVYSIAAFLTIMARIHAAKKPLVALVMLITEFGLTIVFGVLAALIGLVVSSGLADTCDAIQKLKLSQRCSKYSFPSRFPSSPEVDFFHDIAASTAFIWLSFILLLITSIVYIIMLIRHKKSNNQTQEDAQDDPILPL